MDSRPSWAVSLTRMWTSLLEKQWTEWSLVWLAGLIGRPDVRICLIFSFFGCMGNSSYFWTQYDYRWLGIRPFLFGVGVVVASHQWKSDVGHEISFSSLWIDFNSAPVCLLSTSVLVQLNEMCSKFGRGHVRQFLVWCDEFHHRQSPKSENQFSGRNPE